MLTYWPRQLEKLLPGAMDMGNIEKIDNVTWYGHFVIHVVAALNDLPGRGEARILPRPGKIY